MFVCQLMNQGKRGAAQHKQRAQVAAQHLPKWGDHGVAAGAAAAASAPHLYHWRWWGRSAAFCCWRSFEVRMKMKMMWMMQMTVLSIWPVNLAQQ
jgi:hypothetical protein